MYQPNQTFEASVFHPALGNEVATGTIILDPHTFHFQSESITLNVPMSRLRVRVGGGEDERIYFQDGESSEWEVFSSDFALLDHPFVPQMRLVRDRLSRSATKDEVMRRLRIVGYVVAVIVVLVWLADVAMSLVVDGLVARVPPKWEQEWGAEGVKELRDITPFVENTTRLSGLNSVTAPLTNAIVVGTNTLTFFIAEDEEPNACALPGGYVVVTTGLLELVERPEELLGVVAHEVAHVKLKHSLRHAIAGSGPFVLFGVLMGAQGGVVGLLGNATDMVVQSGFSQEYETEADDEGWRILLAAKVDPRGMAEIFRKLDAYDQKLNPDGDALQALSTHPAMKERIARLEKKWRKLKKKEGFVDLAPLSPALRAAAGKQTISP
ncbi:MAG TPA: M48 family metallopeptidase [Verrucomicrobiae bacterium]|nr:M48 family metallopeptidase [Verrucomicrobiae bacterium]